jgi:excisionase family DNA binding protein
MSSHKRLTERAEPAFLTIPAACKYLALGETSVYRLLGAGKLEGKKAGRRTLITFASVKSYASSLPAAEIKVAPRTSLASEA